MRHQNSVFHQLLQHVAWDEFDTLATAHRADARARRLTAKSHFLALLYGQLAGAASLREIVGGIESERARRYHLGATLPRRATLADANRARPAEFFAALLAVMLGRAHRGRRRHLADTTCLIDATGVRLDARSGDWARFSEDVCGATLHVVYDPDPDPDRPIGACPRAGLRPDPWAALTPARVNSLPSGADPGDITAAQAMPIEPGATYVFDLGYYDYAWWAKRDAAQCRIVTRLKANTPLSVVEELPVPADGPILSDRIGHLPARQSLPLARTGGAGCRNPFHDPAREVRVRLDSGKTIRILSNDLDASAQEIADLYKRRWAIELFFRWVKQTLKIRRFLGTSENAVRIPIAVALIAFVLIAFVLIAFVLIAFVLLRLAQAGQNAVASPLAFARLMRLNLRHRRPLDRQLDPEPPPLINPAQMILQWNPT